MASRAMRSNPHSALTAAVAPCEELQAARCCGADWWHVW